MKFKLQITNSRQEPFNSHFLINLKAGLSEKKNPSSKKKQNKKEVTIDNNHKWV